MATRKKSTPSKDEAAAQLIDWHFQVEPGLEQVFRVLYQDERVPLCHPLHYLSLLQAPGGRAFLRMIEEAMREL